MKKINAKEIKSFLKANGYDARKISVRSGAITIKDLSISCHEIKKLVKAEYKIHDVEYDYDIFRDFAMTKMDEAQALLEEIKESKEIRKEVNGFVLTASVGSNGFNGAYTIRNYDDFHYCNQFKTTECLAYALAIFEVH